MEINDEVLTFAQAVAETDAYALGEFPEDVRADLPTSFAEEVFIPSSSRSRVGYFMQGYDAVEDLLEISWQAALQANALRYYEEKVVFPIDAMRGDGETPLEVSIRKGDPQRSGGLSWYVSYVNTYLRTRTISTDVPSKAIERFAWMGPWDVFLEELASIALPETWSFSRTPGRAERYEILKSYICHTFYRLQSENKICISDDGMFAAFNTGLVDRRFDDIYLCFEPQIGQSKWRFSGFAASGNRALKKLVIRHFNPLPQTAQYVDSLEDLLFNPERELLVDYEHVLIDNVDRLPIEFLAEELRGSQEAADIVQSIAEAADYDRDALWERLSDVVETDTRIYRALRNRLEDAIDLAKRRVRWNFKTAIPSYYPRGNSMSLLLPLCLIDELQADAALVVQLQDSGNYQGETILTKEQAYMNARLICRPDSDWLTPGM